MCILFTYTCNITQLSLFCSRLYAFYISCSLTFVLPIEMARLSGVQNTCTPRTKTHRFFFLLTLCIIRLSQHIKLFLVFDLFFYSYHHHHPCTVTPPPPRPDRSLFHFQYTVSQFAEWSRKELKYFHHDFSNRLLNKLFLIATNTYWYTIQCT